MPEQGEQAGLLLLRQLAPADQVDALLRERGGHVLLIAGRVPGHELARAGPDHLQDLAGLQARGGFGGHAGRDAALQSRHPDHEELVQVAGEDRQEVGALQKWCVRVLGELEHAFVERQPAALPVQEPALRQLDAVLDRVLVRVEVGVEVRFQVGDVRGHRVRAVRGYGADGRLCVLDRGLGAWLVHGPILPPREHYWRVGECERQRGEADVPVRQHQLGLVHRRLQGLALLGGRRLWRGGGFIGRALQGRLNRWLRGHDVRDMEGRLPDVRGAGRHVHTPHSGGRPLVRRYAASGPGRSGRRRGR